MSGNGGMIGGIGGLLIGAAGVALAPATFGASYFAAAGLGYAAGSLVGNLIAPPTLPGQTSEGPRLQDLKVQSSTYGKPIPIILGKMRTAGNLLWIKTGGLIEQRVEQTTSGGGGKTGGGASSTQIFYEYYATFAVSVCKGPIKAILKVWADSKLVYNAEATDAGTQTANAKFMTYAHGYLGDESQVADSVIEADLGAGNAPGYRGQAYVVFERFPLKDYGNRIPNFSFEVMALVPTGSGSGAASQYVEVPVKQVLDSTIKLALNFNGADGANADADFKDSSRYNKSLTNSTSGTGIAELDTAQKVFGLASGLFQYQNAYISTQADDDFNLSATAPWQISFRYRTTGPSAYHCLVSKYTGIAGNGEPSAASWNINIGNGVLKWGSDTNGNKTVQLDDAQAMSANTWYAFRISHDGNGWIRFYKDGQILYGGLSQLGDTAFNIVPFTGNNRINIGNIFLTGQPDTDIWLDDFIIQKGGNVTVGTSYTVETTETGGGTITRTQATGGIIEFPDHSGNNRSPVTVTGSPVGTAAQKVFGSASALFAPGSAINYHNADWQSLQNSGEWGIGFRLRFKDAVASAVIMSTGGVVGDGWQLEYDHSLTSIYNGNITTNCRTIKFTHSSGTVLRWAFVLGVSRTDPVADTWYTIGLSYSAGWMRLYVNGVYQPSTKVALGAVNNSGSVFRIGQADGGTISYYLDELIIQDTSGIYAADADYVVPTSVFSADTNTRLLLHFDEIFTAVGAGNWSSGLAYVDTKVSNIIAYLCTQAGLTDFNTDYIALNDNAVVPGFVMNNVAPVRQALEMLAAAFLIDIVESTTTLYFVSRNSLINGGPAAIIPEDDLGARHITQSPVIPLDITTQQEVEIPKELAVRYLDASRDYYEASQRSLKQQTSSIGRVELNLSALCLTDSQAKIAAIGNHMFAWAERKKYKFTLPLKYAWLDCGDLVQIDYSSQSHFVRIVKMNYGAGYFDVEGVGQDFTGISFDVQADGYSGPISTGAFASPPATTQALVVNPTNTVGASGTPAPATINYPVVSTLVLLDMAILSDSEDGEGYYIGIDKGASANYWPGASVYKSSDGSSFATLLGLASALTTGQAINALADGPTDIWDRANTVTIALTNGTLASDTEANVLNGANIGILGDEIIQWTTATLDANGYYVLSGLLRGRRGTEWAIPDHVAGERFILFNTASLIRTAGVPEEIGLARVYRAVTVGLALADQTSQNFTNTAKGLKPYSPVHIAGARDGSNNLTITWIRRTRTGGSWRDNVDVSLGEASEQYAVDIMSGATVLRTITGLASPTTEYTAAQQTADGLTPGNPVTVNIYQISSVVGRGYTGVATI